MNEELLSIIAIYLYMSSILSMIGVILFTPRLLSNVSTEGKIFGWFLALFFTVVVFLITLMLGFSIGGCYENCTGQSDDEIGVIVSGIINWCYAIAVFLTCKLYNKKRQSDA